MRDTKSDRLHLRAPQLSDAADVFAMNSNPEMTKYQSWPPLTEEAQAIRWVEQTMKEHTETPCISLAFVVTTTAENTFIGNIGAESDHDNSATELWYSIAAEHHGKGYATEAVRAMIPLLPEGYVLEIECDPRNAASRKLAERLGFKEVHYEEKSYECKGQWVGLVKYVR
ncbi:acetyltransferase [Microthyrium microscopicum]|uniref:Acetyltransferase n=1 Tax=Microthyrium microscopicum TaxID=703497 RepID=A0A6A6TZE8_9PEZI|nr:acetyltransferase [Microthyrium microscopicum]